jgi:hypothetical protein
VFGHTGPARTIGGIGGGEGRSPKVQATAACREMAAGADPRAARGAPALHESADAARKYMARADD